MPTIQIPTLHNLTKARTLDITRTEVFQGSSLPQAVLCDLVDELTASEHIQIPGAMKITFAGMIKTTILKMKPESIQGLITMLDSIRQRLDDAVSRERDSINNDSYTTTSKE